MAGRGASSPEPACTDPPAFLLRPSSAAAMLRRNLTIYGLGGIVAPFIGIKLIDLVVSQIPGLG